MSTQIVLEFFGCSALLLLLVFKKLSKKKREQVSSRRKVIKHNLWNTALFFPDYTPEKEDSTTRQFIWYLNQATETIDVCMYGFAFPMIKDAIIQQAKSGVVIRIITNRIVHGNRAFVAAGIQTRRKRHIWRNKMDLSLLVDLMHNKFVVIDRFAVLTGSLNWTWSSISENKENVVITTNTKCVEKYSNEFERLWEECGWKFNSNEMEMPINHC